MENENSVEDHIAEELKQDNVPVQNAGGTLPKKKKGLIAGLIILGSLIILYLMFSFFFMSHFYFRTTIAGVDYSCQNKEKVRQQILNPEVDFTITFLGRNDEKETISTDTLGMSYVFDDTMTQILASQNGFGWIRSVFAENHYELPVYVSYDQNALAAQLKQLSLFDQTKQQLPVDACIGEYQTESRTYEIVKEQLGTTLNLKKTIDSVEEAFKGIALGQAEVEIDLEAAECYELPTIYETDEELVKALQTANTFVSANITYDWNGHEELVDADTIHDWVEIEKRSVRLNEEAVETYVKELSKKYDTYGKNRIFTTTAGIQVELRSGYGWKTDKEAETAALIEEIRKGITRKKEPIYQRRGYVKGENDIGNSYVEINLSAQHLYLYQQGAIVFETDFVSGNMSNGNATPAGVFGITYKTRDAVLRGVDYETPVSYWMPYNGNIGMHDATWRAEFGGEIYLASGSHGCINLPLDSAAVIYGYMETGFPIVSYY